MNKSIAIILVNWNGLQHTTKCLASLRQSEYKDIQIIVVDNGSSESEIIALREFNDIHLIENGDNLGFTGGNNVGIQYAYDNGFEIIMLLNNDTTVSPDFLMPLTESLIKNETAAVQPLIFSMQEPEKIWSAGGGFNQWSGMPYTIGEGQIGSTKFNKPFEVEWLTGCCIAFHREMVDEVGQLDDRFFALCEDVDWSFRAVGTGRKLIVVPASKVYHFQGASTTSQERGKEGYRSPFRQYLNIRNHLYILRKYPDRAFVITAYSYHILRALAFLGYFLFRRRWKKFSITWLALWDGLSRLQTLKMR